MDKKISLDIAAEFYYLAIPASGHQSLFSSVFAYDALIRLLSERDELTLHGYCLFQDSIHLLVQSHSQPSLWIDSWLMQYNQWHQQVTGDSGYLFQDDHKHLVLIQPRYLPKTLKYLHELPITKKLCGKIDQYPYSSHALYLTNEQTLIDAQRILTIISPHNGQRIRRYEDYMHGVQISIKSDIELGNHAYYHAYADQAYITRILSNYGISGNKNEEEEALALWHSCLSSMHQATQLDTQTLIGIRRHSILPDAHFILAWLYVEMAKGPLYIAAKQLGLDEMTLKLNIKSVQLHHPDSYLRYIAQSWQATSSVA